MKYTITDSEAAELHAQLVELRTQTRMLREQLDASKPVPYYQLCPKCNGQGIVSRPPWVAGDVDQWSGTEPNYTCDVCNGGKILLVNPEK